jgi:hypothetical protein
MILDTAERSYEHTKRIQLLGFMKIHNSGCERESGCVCHGFLEDFFKKKKLTGEEEQLKYYQFLKALTQDYTKRYPGMLIFKLIYSYLLFLRLDSKVMAIHAITEAGREKLSFSEEFMVYRLKFLFEEKSREK